MNRSPENNPYLRFLISYIVGLYSVQILTLALSLVHVHITAWLARGILAAALALALFFYFFHHERSVRLFTESLRLKGWALVGGFLLFSALVYGILWLSAYIMPDLSWDGNAYHIPAMGMWDAQGYVSWVKTPYLEGIINGYPKGMELVSYITVKALGNSIINATNLLFLPLGVLGIATLASLLGVNSWLSLCAGAAFILIPININQSVTTYVDSAFASAAIALISLAAGFCNPVHRKWRNVVALGAAMGLTLSVKSTGVAVSGIALIAALVILILDQARRLSRSGQRDGSLDRIENPASILVALIVIAITASLGGGYWYLRNYFLTGTPLYPAGLTVFGHVVFPGSSILSTISGESNTPEQLRGLSPFVQVLFTWTQGLRAWPLSLKGYDTRQAGLGFLWLLGCVPAILIALISFRQFSVIQKRILLLTLFTVGLTFVLTPLNWWSRYTLWIYGLGLPIFAWVLTDTVFNSSRRHAARIVASAWLILCATLLLFEAGYCTVDVVVQATPGPLRNHLSSFYRRSSWKWPAYYLDPALGKTPLKHVLDHYEVVAMGPHRDMDVWEYAGMVGQLYQPLGARRIIFLSEEPDQSELAGLDKVEYILWDVTVPLPPELNSMAVSVQRAKGFLVLTLP